MALNRVMPSTVQPIVTDLLKTAIAFDDMKLTPERRSDELELLTELGSDDAAKDLPDDAPSPVPDPARPAAGPGPDT